MAAGGLLLAGAPLLDARGAAGPIEILMRSDADGAHVGFDPVGLLIEPGQSVRWVSEANFHSATAYHPVNGDHSLRIPRRANPWDSDILQPGEHFETVLTVEGVYDYFCAPHEAAGMVGRLVVGSPSGPGTLPFDYFKGGAEGRTWLDVPPLARMVFPAIAEIMSRKVIAARGLPGQSPGHDHMAGG